jgi:hypothetical protein
MIVTLLELKEPRTEAAKVRSLEVGLQAVTFVAISARTGRYITDKLHHALRGVVSGCRDFSSGLSVGGSGAHDHIGNNFAPSRINGFVDITAVIIRGSNIVWERNVVKLTDIEAQEVASSAQIRPLACECRRSHQDTVDSSH